MKAEPLSDFSSSGEPCRRKRAARARHVSVASSLATGSSRVASGWPGRAPPGCAASGRRWGLAGRCGPWPRPPPVDASADTRNRRRWSSRQRRRKRRCRFWSSARASAGQAACRVARPVRGPSRVIRWMAALRVRLGRGEQRGQGAGGEAVLVPPPMPAVQGAQRHAQVSATSPRVKPRCAPSGRRPPRGDGRHGPPSAAGAGGTSHVEWLQRDAYSSVSPRG